MLEAIHFDADQPYTDSAITSPRVQKHYTCQNNHVIPRADSHCRKNAPGMFTTINLPSGTHHLKFVVDGEMVTSPDLPTAVDFNNFLVNYIEIATEDLTKPRRESAQPGGRSTALTAEEHEHGRSGEQTPEDSDIEEPRAEEIPPGDFRPLVPQALVDVDLPEDDQRYHDAVRVIQESGCPPSLPMFLSRSILNGILPVKDDNSVLTLPNHTVLNHLMTSSVKNGVLATSVTTRYKKKVSSFLGDCSATELTCPVCNDHLLQARAKIPASHAVKFGASMCLEGFESWLSSEL